VRLRKRKTIYESHAARARRHMQEGRPYSHYRDTSGKTDTRFKIKAAACVAIFAITAIVRFINFGPFEELKNDIKNRITNGVNYKEVVAVIGRAVSEEHGLSELIDNEAVKVFSSKFFGGEEPEDNENDGEIGEDAKTKDEEYIEKENSSEDAEITNDGKYAVENGESMRVEDSADPGDVEDLELYESTTTIFRTQMQMPKKESLDFSEIAYDIGDSKALESSEVMHLLYSVPDETRDTSSWPDIVEPFKKILPFSYCTPVKGTLTSGFGYRKHPISGQTTFHYGVDIAAKKGTRINSFADGEIMETGTGNVYGKYVKVLHKGGYYTFYGHLDKINVKQGQKVEKGMQIGEVGTTGMSTGAHLHFEVRSDNKILNAAYYVYE